MATTRLTFGAVLDTVQQTANTVTSVLSATNKGVSILTAFVDKASDEQKVRHVADKEVFIENLIREKSEERAVSDLKIEKFIAQSTAHKQHYSDAYSTFTKLLRGDKPE